MKQSVKDKIIAALRTATLPQGIGSYRRTGMGIEAEYCALGIVAEAFDFDWNRSPDSPAQFLTDLGVNFYTRSKIMQLNDFGGWSFSMIADWIDNEVQADDDTNLSAEVEEIVSQIGNLTVV